MEFAHDIILWLVTLEALSFIVYPFLAVVLKELPDRGYGVSKPFGFLVFGYIAWLIPSLQLAPFSRELIFCIFIALALLSHLWVTRQFQSWSKVPYPKGGYVLAVESVFLGGFLFLCVLQAYHPEIFWGEKPMDSTFLNYFIRSDSFPPEDPWAAGRFMNYYYAGYAFFAALHKVTQIDPWIGYNLSIASVGALLLGASYTAFARLVRSPVAAAFGALLAVFISNLEVLRLTFFGKNSVGFDLFWASSRVFTSPGINEYPFWSLLFADLHGHLMALPIGMTVVSLSLALFGSSNELKRNRFLTILFISLSWGLLFLVNSWDFITYGLFLGCVYLYRLRRFASEQGIFVDWQLLVGIFIDGLLTVFFALSLISPFLLSSGGGIRAGIGWVTATEFNTAYQLIRVHGHWLIPALLSALCLTVIEWHRKATFISVLGSILFGFVPIGCGIWSHWQRGTTHIPWFILVFSGILVMLGFFRFWTRSEDESTHFVGILMMLLGLVITFAELWYLIDRMNTLFKFHLAVGILLSLVSYPLVIKAASHWNNRLTLSRITSRTGVVLCSFVLLIAIVGSVILGVITVTFQRIPGPRPTLNGGLYLQQENRDEYDLIRWIKSTVKGTPVLLEAYGPPYQDFTRITMHTGLRTVLGWPYHVEQRGTPRQEVEERASDIKSIYSTSDLREAQTKLNKYHVALIVVGELERKTYPGVGVKKFDERPDLFPVLFRSGKVALYTTTYAELAFQ